YTYTFTGLEDKDISHFILEVSDNFIDPDGDGSDYELGNWKEGISPDNFWGLKFNYEEKAPTAIYTIETDRIPVWGVFYIKGGADNSVGDNGPFPKLEAWSSALDLDNYPNQNDGWYEENLVMARPDTAVPIPGAVWLLGSGLLGLVGLRARRKK
ncbi:MAG: hypothetical protein ACOCVU_01220, partial [Desulfohalobiaceae bacterium]